MNTYGTSRTEQILTQLKLVNEWLACNCAAIDEPDNRLGFELEELGDKASAKIMLANKQRQIVVPTLSEWFGFNLLERDGEL